MYEACGSACRMIELLVVQECLCVCVICYGCIIAVVLWRCILGSCTFFLFFVLCFSFFSPAILTCMSTCCTDCVKGDAVPVE